MRALGDISATIKNLQNLIKTVLRDSPDQKERDSKISEVLHQRSKSYAVFENALRRMSWEERRITRFGALSWLWKEFPQKMDLDDKIGNAKDLGDGSLYTDCIGCEQGDCCTQGVLGRVVRNDDEYKLCHVRIVA